MTLSLVNNKSTRVFSKEEDHYAKFKKGKFHKELYSYAET